jgi:exopolysaccharide production protein ExoQ
VQPVKPLGSTRRMLTAPLPIMRQSRFFLALETIFVILSILVFSRALVFSLLDTGTLDVAAGVNADGSEPAVISQPKIFWLYVPIYLGTGLLILPRLRQVWRALRAEKYVALLLLLAVLSTVWSTAPRESLAKAIALIACTLFGVHLAIRYDTRQLLRLFAVAFAAIMLASVLVAIRYPQIGIMHGTHEGIWCGVFLHKNSLGSYMLLAGIVYFLLTTVRAKTRILYHAAFWLAFALLTLSCAKSSLLSWLLLFTILGAYFVRIKRPLIALFAMMAVVLAAGAFVMQYQYKVLPPILLEQIATSVSTSVFGPSSSLAQLGADIEAAQLNAPPSAFLATGDGRLRLWGELWEMIQERPWLGYGLGGFWRGMHGPSAQIWKLEEWHPPGAHNSFIDVWLDLGILGLGLLALSIWAALTATAAPLVKGAFNLDLLFPTAMLIALCLAKVGESGLFGANVLTWIMFVTAVINAQKIRASSDIQSPLPKTPEPASRPA